MIAWIPMCSVDKSSEYGMLWISTWPDDMLSVSTACKFTLDERRRQPIPPDNRNELNAHKQHLPDRNRSPINRSPCRISLPYWYYNPVWSVLKCLMVAKFDCCWPLRLVARSVQISSSNCLRCVDDPFIGLFLLRSACNQSVNLFSPTSFTNLFGRLFAKCTVNNIYYVFIIVIVSVSLVL